MSGAAQELAGELERLFRLLAARRGALAPDDEAGALTATQKVALNVVAGEGPLRLGELGGRLGVTDPTATRVADALEGMGLARRVRETDDRRAVRIEATPKGRRLVRRRREQLERLLEEPLAHLDEEERERVARVLADLNAALEAAPVRS